jgi:hypothetical protein
MATAFILCNKADVFLKKLKAWLKRKQKNNCETWPSFDYKNSWDLNLRRSAINLIRTPDDIYRPEKDLLSGNL